MPKITIQKQVDAFLKSGSTHNIIVVFSGDFQKALAFVKSIDLDLETSKVSIQKTKYLSQAKRIDPGISPMVYHYYFPRVKDKLGILSVEANKP